MLKRRCGWRVFVSLPHGFGAIGSIRAKERTGKVRKLLGCLLGLVCTLFSAPSHAANLPAGFTELEYIGSTGRQQYIDTGRTLSAATNDVELVFQLTDATVSQNIFGARGSTTNRVYTFASYYNTNLRAGWGSTTALVDVIPDTNKHTLKIEHNGGIFKLDGATIAEYGNASITTPTTATLFAIHATGSTELYYGATKIYEYKLWNNGTLVQHLIPVKYVSGNTTTYGMYDLMDNNPATAFHTNAGTGEFTAGPVVLDPCRNLFDYNARQDGYYQSEDGSLAVQNGDAVSDFIRVQPNTTYYLSQTGSRRGKFFDANKQPIQTSTFDFTAASSGTSFTTGATTYYVRFGMSGQTVDRTKIQLEQGSIATPYVPYCATTIKIASTKYVETEFAPVNAALANAVVAVNTVVTQTVAQAAQIAELQSVKQTRPNPTTTNGTCPAGKKCLLVEDESGIPHWYEIFDPINEWYDGWLAAGQPAFRSKKVSDKWEEFNGFYRNDGTWRKTYVDNSTDGYSRPFYHATRCTEQNYDTIPTNAKPCYSESGMFKKLMDGEWAVVYTANDNTGSPTGVVYGTSKCAPVAGTNDYSKENPTLLETMSAADQAAWAVEPDATNKSANNGYTNCWCKTTAVGTPGENNDMTSGDIYPVNPESSSWVFVGTYGAVTNCAERCAYHCEYYARSAAGFRSALFGLNR